jgi:hypothetical protein
MSDIHHVEFFKMAQGDQVGKVLKTIPLSFESEDDFVRWAKKALPAHRGDKRIWEWPDAIRVCAADGTEIYRWTAWDQLSAKEPLANTRGT